VKEFWKSVKIWQNINGHELGVFWPAGPVCLGARVGDAENARHEIVGHENAAPECKGGKCETW